MLIKFGVRSYVSGLVLFVSFWPVEMRPKFEEAKRGVGFWGLTKHGKPHTPPVDPKPQEQSTKPSCLRVSRLVRPQILTCWFLGSYM